jgi:hypothetical protein
VLQGFQPRWWNLWETFRLSPRKSNDKRGWGIPFCALRHQVIWDFPCQWRSDKIEINIIACHLCGRGFDSRSPIPHVIKRATLSDSVGFLRGLRFPPTLHYESPNIVYGANDMEVSYKYENDTEHVITLWVRASKSWRHLASFRSDKFVTYHLIIWKIIDDVFVIVIVFVLVRNLPIVLLDAQLTIQFVSRPAWEVTFLGNDVRY